MTKYTYRLSVVADENPNATIFVPNGEGQSLKIIDIWRFLTGKRQGFPVYNEADLTVVGIDESAWQTKLEYRRNYTPPNFACIVREPV